MKTISKYFPHFLLAVYAIEWTVLAITPYDRAVWKAENFPIMAIVALLVFLYVRGVRFSNLGYALASVLIFWHTVGGYYTFERVPFDFFINLFDIFGRTIRRSNPARTAGLVSTAAARDTGTALTL